MSGVTASPTWKPRQNVVSQSAVGTTLYILQARRVWWRQALLPALATANAMPVPSADKQGHQGTVLSFHSSMGRSYQVLASSVHKLVRILDGVCIVNAF